METDAAKRRLAELFESDTSRSADRQSTAIVAPDRRRPFPTTAEKHRTACQSCHSAPTPGIQAKTAIPVVDTRQTKRDLSVSSFMLTLVLMGVIVAANTDRPLFWLLIGPAPVAVLHAVGTLLRQNHL